MRAWWVLMALSLGVAAQDPLGRQLPMEVEAANQLFEAQDYEGAKALYEKLYEQEPENGALAYNLANVYNALGEAEKATELYKQAIESDNKTAAARGRFNLGTLQMGGQQPQEAVTSFTDYLRENPDDVDAKRNLELALRMMEQQQQQQQQGDPQDQDQNQSEDRQQNQQAQNQEGGEDQQQQQQQQNGEGDDQESSEQQQARSDEEQNQDSQAQEDARQSEPKDEQGEEQAQQQPRENESDENALNDQVKEQILEALNEQELNQQKQYQQRRIGTVKRRAKDW